MGLLDRLKERSDRRPPKREYSSLAERLRVGRRDVPPDAAEVRRVVRLPFQQELKEFELEQINRDVLQARAFQDGFRLFPIQAAAINAYRKMGGLFAPIGCGLGKTAITLMIAAHAYRELHIAKSLLLVPPQVYEQLFLRDIPWARRRMVMPVQFHGMAGKSKAQRARMVEKGLTGCYIMPYSFLSTADSIQLLEGINPGLIIADEAHLLKNRTAARTKRLINFIRDNNPQLVCLSGTITSKGINDYSHLIRFCLGEGCPLPRSPVMCQEWGAVLDSTDNPPGSDQMRVLFPLLDWARQHYPLETFPATQSGLRKAYRHRLTICPGVVATGDADIGTSLVFQNLPVERPESRPGFQDLEKLMQKVQDEFLTPNDDEIEFAIHTFKWCYELSSGFYNELVWPDPETLSEREGIPIPEAKSRLDRAREHHQASQEYARELRDFLRDPPKGLDTPMLVGGEIARGGKRVDRHLSGLWRTMKDLDFEGRPVRDSRVVRVCDFKVRHGVRWARELKGSGGIIWVQRQEMGIWMLEALLEAGLPGVDCSAGAAGNRRISDPANKDKICVASIDAHSVGKNLQHFQHQLFLQWPRPAKDAEQAVGRLHREGQEADELIVHTCHTLPWDHVLYAATLSDAVYIQQTTGLRQKIIFGTHTPLPRIYPTDFLKERGMQPLPLNQEQLRIFQERFSVDETSNVE